MIASNAAYVSYASSSGSALGVSSYSCVRRYIPVIVRSRKWMDEVGNLLCLRAVVIFYWKILRGDQFFCAYFLLCQRLLRIQTPFLNMYATLRFDEIHIGAGILSAKSHCLNQVLQLTIFKNSGLLQWFRQSHLYILMPWRASGVCFALQAMDSRVYCGDGCERRPKIEKNQYYCTQPQRKIRVKSEADP